MASHCWSKYTFRTFRPTIKNILIKTSSLRFDLNIRVVINNYLCNNWNH